MSQLIFTREQSDLTILRNKGCSSLMEATGMSDTMRDGAVGKTYIRRRKIENYLRTHNDISDAAVRSLCGVSGYDQTYSGGLAGEGKLIKCHVAGHWEYKKGENGEIESTRNIVGEMVFCA